MTIEEKIDFLINEMSSIKNEVTDIKLTLENETNNNISIIAEAHKGLLDKFDDVTKPYNEIEMIKLKITSLSSEIEKLKKKIG